MNKLLIFGGTGFVGGHLALRGAAGYEVVTVGRGPGTSNSYRQCNPGDSAAVAELVSSEAPGAVVNAAAISGIDYAEQHREEAYRANVEGAKAIAAAAYSVGARHVHLSSDAVFSGNEESYAEEDLPGPVNYYGLTKAQAEEAVRRAHPLAAMVRVSLILGFPVTEATGFLAVLASKLSKGEPLRAPEFEYRTPIDVTTLCDAILELLSRDDAAGIWHVAATEAASRYDITRRILRGLGADEGKLERQTSPSTDPSRAPRHRNGILAVDKAKRLLKTPVPSLEEAITRALATGDERTRK